VEGAIKSGGGKKEVVGSISGHWDKVLSFRCAQTGKTDALYEYQWAQDNAKLNLVSTPASNLATDSLHVWGKVCETPSVIQ